MGWVHGVEENEQGINTLLCRRGDTSGVYNAFRTSVFTGFAERRPVRGWWMGGRRRGSETGAIMSATGQFIGTRRVRYRDVGGVDNPTVYRVI